MSVLTVWACGWIATVVALLCIRQNRKEIWEDPFWEIIGLMDAAAFWFLAWPCAICAAAKAFGS